MILNDSLANNVFYCFNMATFMQMPSAEKSSDEGKKTKKVSQKLSNTSTYTNCSRMTCSLYDISIAYTKVS